MTGYTVAAERGRRRWSLQAIEVPGAISEVDRLTQTQEEMREAIAFVTGEPEETIEVDVVPVLSQATREHLDNARRLRAYRFCVVAGTPKPSCVVKMRSMRVCCWSLV
jgi:hypothetical protein